MPENKPHAHDAAITRSLHTLHTKKLHSVQNKRPFHANRLQIGSCFIALLAILALAAPLIAPSTMMASPLMVNLDAPNLPIFSSGHFLGTDYLGRDLLAQAAWGSRASLFVGLAAAAVAVSFGSMWGALSAFAGGIVDSIMMRIVDGLLAIPSIILLLAFNSLISTPSLTTTTPKWILSLLHVTSYSYGFLPMLTVILVISATTWLEAARISRAKVVGVLSEEYITAAQSLGMSTKRMLFKHLLPNSATVLMVEATLLVSDAVLMESGLSFLGLGLGPSTPSWGSMLSASQMSLLEGNWWAVVIPGFLITLTVAAVNLLGEGWLESRSQVKY